VNTSELPQALVTHSLPEEWLTSLVGRCRTLVGPSDATNLAPALAGQLGEAAGLFTLLTIPVDEALLRHAPRLRVVSNMAVGVDNVDVAACSVRGIPVGNTPGVLTEATADLALAALLSAARRLPEAALDAREGRWTTWRPAGWLGADLNGAVLGIVGLGKIGRAVAGRAHGFGLQLRFADQNDAPDIEESLGARRMELGQLLKESDFVSLHVPLTAETRGLIGEEALHSMKPSAVLVNTARGPVVDTQALYRALSEGWIAGAALDVTDPEPLPRDHPLYGLPNCLILPHIGSATRGTRRRMAELACENLLAGLEGRRLPHCVNPQVYGS
jgi:lactate dehydrogenase-like 2-hydroxyacid dehydrogenase